MVSPSRPHRRRPSCCLTITAAGGGTADRGQLTAKITDARKLDGSQVEAAISELITAGLLQPLPGGDPRVALTGTSQARYHQIRAVLDEVTARLFGSLPPDDLATAGRVLAIVTARANAEAAGLSAAATDDANG